MALGPAQVHPQQHVGPVRRLGAPGTGADRHDRVLGVVVAGEQEERPLALELASERVRLALEVRGRLRVGGVVEEGQELEQVVGPLLEGPPEGDLLAQPLGLAEDLLCRALVVPEAGLAGAAIEVRKTGFLGG
jgi:hypothetical protein